MLIIENQKIPKLRTVNLNGKKEILKGFLYTLCYDGFYTNSYEDVIKHFAINDELLSNEKPCSLINFGNVKSQTEVVKFVYFLKYSEIIDQPLNTILPHFLFNNKPIINAYRLANKGLNHNPIPYNFVLDTDLRIILKDLYNKNK